MDTVETLHNKIVSGEVTIRAIVEASVAKAKADTRNIFREVFTDINEQIARAEKMLADGTATALTGIPVVLKDNIMFAGHIAGACSHMLDHHTAAYDSTAVVALKEAGAVIIGRTNMDDGAMGSSTENSAYGVTKHPLDETRVPGGSSGGSAAAVLAGIVPIALGSDTGGSIRQPASLCGIVGLLPTYGTVSRHGLIAMGSSLDVIGPMAHTVADARTLYTAIARRDVFDATTVAHVDHGAAQPLRKKIAIPRGIFDNGGVDDTVKKNFFDIRSKMEKEGYVFEEVDLPHFGDALAVYYIIMPAEVSSNLARLEGVRYGERVSNDSVRDMYEKTRGKLFGKEVRRRILLGTYVLSHGYYDAYYTKALALRVLIQRELEDVLMSYDAVFTPTSPTPAFKIGEKANDPVQMYLADLFTVPANIAQHPAISVPSGQTDAGLPLGIQFIGARFAEETLFALGKVVESVR